MELHQIFLPASTVVFLFTTLLALHLTWRPYKQKALLRATYVFTGGVFVAATLLFFPLNYPPFEDSATPILTALLSSAHSTIRLFLVDCDFADIIQKAGTFTPLWKNLYVCYSSVLFLICPILTAGALLSFFARISAYNKYLFCFHKDAYIFSELNERSIALAKSFKEAKKNRVVIFTDVFDEDDETSFELIEQAKALDAILFKDDITVINFKRHSKKKKLYFFIIGSDEIESIRQTKVLTSAPRKKDKSRAGRYNRREHGYDYDGGDIRLFLFTVNFSSEQLLSSVHPQHMSLKVRRVNDVQSLIYNVLYEHGMDIFDSAQETDATVYNPATDTYDKEKKISALIIGMGLHGTEMIKALSWFCQMHPYSVEINAFDREEQADLAFMSAYPDLFDINLANPDVCRELTGDKKYYHNGDVTTPGEAHYRISVHPGYDATLYSFDKKILELLEELKTVTYIFVALGNDDLNIQIASKLRILLKRGIGDLSCEPVIHTVVYNPVKVDAGDKYSIFVCGDINSNYSEDCLMNSELERLALERHMAYTHQCIAEDQAKAPLSEDEIKRRLKEAEDQFWSVDYNYRSSVASAIHSKFKRQLDLPGARKVPKNRSDGENRLIRVTEHQRWNAYVRSEGYVYAPVRNKVIKTHHLLVPFDKLPLSEQIKDDD